jgi:uncharacterized damage-inducible protein DinB
MQSATEVLAGIFRVNSQLTERAFEGIEAKDLCVRPLDRANSLQFILGHLTTYRYSIVQTLTGEVTCPFGELFIRGIEPRPAVEYPEVSRIFPIYRDISKELLERLSSAPENLLTKELPRRFPNGENTVLGGLSFYALHDSYHVGQLGAVRKLLGYDRLVG